MISTAELISILIDSKELKYVSRELIEKMLKEYPYCNTLRYLIQKKNEQTNIEIQNFVEEDTIVYMI
jgi:hypothetical protein